MSKTTTWRPDGHAQVASGRNQILGVPDLRSTRGLDRCGSMKKRMGYPRRLEQIRLPVGGNLDHWGQEICSIIPAVREAPVAIMVCDERCRSVRGQGAFWPTRNPIDSSTESDPGGRAASGGSHQPRSWEATSDESSPRPVEPDKSVTVFIGLPDGSTAVASVEGHGTMGDVRQQLKSCHGSP